MTQQLVPTVLGRVAIDVDGSGPTIVFWPSLLMTGSLWEGQRQHLAATHQVVLVDPPGHGASDPLTDSFTFEECAQVVVDVLDHLGVERADLVGNSWGGMIGATFAARHPERVRRAVLMNATASPAGRRQRLEFGALLLAARLLRGLRPPLTRSVLKAFLGPTSLRERPEAVAHVRAAAAAVEVSSVSHAVRSVVPDRPDQLALLATVTAPILVVAGREDATFPVEETRRMAGAAPNATFVVLEGVGHLAALEDPAQVNALVEDFLTSG
ncbi:alpha/beta hydrolase [Aeromicrobium sp. Root495]|uniref:alpha/beta fold hydrolase n=1 Tax=Aeromicrobium sp. Root495 TaxID=1736550 RepID=UPI0006F9C2BC|nr:alpha/beta fold hydrolase [Aeromicrobium sp. Root495]KQY58653.1 alpha/beta hydrolase [Aeromicrobium sp. Root495]